MADKKLYREALDQVRESYREEIEKTVKALIDVRDDPDTPARDIINASKSLVVILGVPRPAEQKMAEPTGKKGINPADWDLSPEERERIAKIIADD